VSGAPRAVVGMLAYNRAEYVTIALESLLGQTCGDFVLLVQDDGSSDGTDEIIESYARDDPRVHFERNAENLGVVQNWRKAFRRAGELYPDAPYFAWATDHDVWHPRWLERLVEELDDHPEVVLTYPYATRVSGEGEVIQLPWAFETWGIEPRRERLLSAVRGMAAGDMIYGLYRREALARAGVYRAVVGADRLVLSELSLHGQYKQVPELLWYRRFKLEVTSARQRKLYFPERIPLYMYLPWWVMHSGAMLYNLGALGSSRPTVGRVEGAGVAVRYFAHSAVHQIGRGLSRRYRRALRRPAVRAARRLVLALTPALSRVTGRSLPAAPGRERPGGILTVNPAPGRDVDGGGPDREAGGALSSS